MYGRYSENYKSFAQADKLRLADEKFKQNLFLEAIELVFAHLQPVEGDKINIEKKAEGIYFSFVQGRMLISGDIGEKTGKIYIPIASLNKLSAPVLRRMLELNFKLRYSKIILDDTQTHIGIQAIWENEAINPSRMVAILREIAYMSEKSEILRADFPFLSFPAKDETTSLTDSEQTKRYTWLIQQIQTCLDKVKNVNNSQLTGGVAYLLMNTLYKIDYFLTPYGKLQADIEMIHGIYYADNDKTTEDKNRLIIKEFEKIIQMPEEKIKECLYRGKAVFSITRNTTIEQIFEEFSRARSNYSWYKDNNHTEMALSVLEHAVTYNFFSYSMPLLLAELLQLALQVGHAEDWTYFSYGEVLFDPKEARFPSQIGLWNKFLSPKSHFNIPEIQKTIKNIIQKHKNDYPQLSFSIENLKFNHLTSFYLSYFTEIEKIKFES